MTIKRYVLLVSIFFGGLLLLEWRLSPAPETMITERVPEVAAMPIRTPVGREDVAENVAIATKSATENGKTENVSIGTKSVFGNSSVQQDDTVLVTRVVDGDTIEIEDGEKVRYIGVNTPESVDPRRAVQCFGKEASAYNKKLVEGKRVRLEPDVEDRDKYHRLLRYVWLGDTMVNEQLMQDGYAQVMTIPPNVKYVEIFKQAQTVAREARKGLWGKCKKT